MKTSIKKELAQHVIDMINNEVLTNDNKDDWHFHAFNEDYYIVYHSKALDWLKTHDINAFEAIEIVQEYEKDNFGETNTKTNPESIVNMLAYIYGEELIYSTDCETVEELKEEMQSITAI